MAQPPKDQNKQPIAIALSYDAQSGDAPRVAASGKGAVAEQILALAFANGVKVREDPDLAELLATVDVDSIIPLEAFAAVAEIVAYLYKVNALPRPDAPISAPSNAFPESPQNPVSGRQIYDSVAIAPTEQTIIDNHWDQNPAEKAARYQEAFGFGQRDPFKDEN